MPVMARRILVVMPSALVGAVAVGVLVVPWAWWGPVVEGFLSGLIGRL